MQLEELVTVVLVQEQPGPALVHDEKTESKIDFIFFSMNRSDLDFLFTQNAQKNEAGQNHHRQILNNNPLLTYTK